MIILLGRERKGIYHNSECGTFYILGFKPGCPKSNAF